MARRTKKQKIAAASRHQFEDTLKVNTENGQIHIISTDVVRKESTPSHLPVPSHAYVLKDVRNTITITTILIALDIAIYFLLKLKFVNIPGIGF